MPPFEVPPLVRERAMSNRRAGQAWLASLPDQVAALADRWDLEVGDAFRGGTAALVVAATTSAGIECVLKIAMPLDMDEVDTFGRSARVHRFADGRGCAALIEHDDAERAMVLERLGPNLAELGLDVPETLEAIAATLRAFWRPMDPECELPTGVDQAQWLASYVVRTWEELDHPCPRDVIDRAVVLCDERSAAFDPAAAVLVHGDAHGWNTLAAGEAGYKFVDPEGLWSEPAHDLSVAMREYNEPLLAGDTAALVRQRAEQLATWCDTDAEAVWQWGFIERVSTGLANVRDFGIAQGAPFLEVARRSR